MVLSCLWTGILLVSILCAAMNGTGSILAPAALRGAQEGIQLAIAMGGSLCLWSGLGALMEKNGMSAFLSRMIRPLLRKLFPSSAKDPVLENALSGNICANFLGLGNAATPLGIRAACRMKRTDTATDELCRLIVMNTASIQLIPGNVASVRSALGCGTPFDILPAVWITSLLSVSAGLGAAWILGRCLRK